MIVVAISDTHSQHKNIKLPPGDVLVHAGDATNRGGIVELEHFIRWYGSQKHKYKIFVAGNHDKGLANENRGLVKQLLKENNIIYLENKLITIEGITFWGSPVTPKFHEWSFQKTRGDSIAKTWVNIPENLDFLITHGPPNGILDQNKDGFPCGCEELYKAICRTNPKVHLFGHIHESAGTFKDLKTSYYNLSQVDEHHKLIYKPYVIDTDTL